MNDIERYLDEVCRTLGGSRDLREHVREELRDHLADAVAANMAKGVPEKESVAKAIADFGRPEETKKGLESIYGHSLTAFLVDRAIAWKEQNMKSGWKWSFAAFTILIIVSAAQVFFVSAAFVFIFPWINEGCQKLEVPLPSWVAGVLRVAIVVRNEIPLVLIALILIAFLWALFEWRCKTENKPLIRLTAAAFVTLVITTAFCITAIATVIPLLQLVQLARWGNPAPSVRSRLADVDQAFVSFRDAVASGDSHAKRSTAMYFTTVLSDLQAPCDLTTLVSLRHDGEMAQLRTMIDNLHAQTWAVRLDATQKNLDELTRTWDEFRKPLNLPPDTD